jgi:hypothetical protein
MPCPGGLQGLLEVIGGPHFHNFSFERERSHRRLGCCKLRRVRDASTVARDTTAVTRVTNVKIPYYSQRRNGRGFWEPRPHMRALRFRSVPCGPDGPEAWAIAEEWNRRVQLPIFLQRANVQA